MSEIYGLFVRRKAGWMPFICETWKKSSIELMVLIDWLDRYTLAFLDFLVSFDGQDFAPYLPLFKCKHVDVFDLSIYIYIYIYTYIFWCISMVVKILFSEYRDGNHINSGVEGQEFKSCILLMCLYMSIGLNSYEWIVHPFNLMIVQSPSDSPSQLNHSLESILI